jgi:hypothetical protein
MSVHRHKAATETTHGWSRCCASPSQGCSGASHGGVTFVELCACGALRRTESNGCHTLQGRWEEPLTEEAAQ